MSDTYRIEPLPAPPDATVRVPGSKSLTNRALICAALADGTSTLTGALRADDTDAMVGALRTLGVVIASTDEANSPNVNLRVDGTAGKVPAGPADLDARLSGTTARFLGPVLAAGTGPYRLDGAAPLRARPMGPVIEALRSLGASVVEEGLPAHLPVRIEGGATGGRVELAGHISSQFLSGLLLAGPLYAHGIDIHLTTPLVSAPYVELTRRVIRAFGLDVSGTSVAAGCYQAADFTIEPDASAASYFFAAAAITGGRVTVEGLAATSVQGDTGFVDVLEAMGATVERGGDSITVTGGGVGGLHGVTVDMSERSDTAQTLAAVAVFADSPTTVTGIGFIRGKETDRIANTVVELRRCGIEADEHEDGFTIHPGMPSPATVQTYDDHRMAMSFALLGLRSPGIEIADSGCVAKTYPEFFADLEQLRVRDR